MQLKASITSAMPYFLEQIQQGANYLMLAAERMATVDQHDHALVTTVEVRRRRRMASGLQGVDGLCCMEN